MNITVFFLVKKIIGMVLSPLTLFGLLFLCGFLFCRSKSRQNIGRFLIALAAFALLVLSYQPVADRLVGPLERKYPPLINRVGLPEIRWIVVLGGGHTSDPSLPVTGQIDETTLVRLTEGIRLQRLCPGSKLLLSGGAVYDLKTNAEIMAEVAETLGVKRNTIVLETISRDTADEAEAVGRIVGHDRFFLVTSAYHMARAMLLFENAGLRPISAPTGHLVKTGNGKRPPNFYFPRTDNLRKSEIALHEYLGILWVKTGKEYR
ncbi:MAG: ElyC/SanA/YdcF family protein [Candidatus Omnitrophota bacterium]|nr:YdcF family protein [Candidatus Omnitrophota bacterium]